MLKKVLIGILVLVVLGVAGFLALAVLVLKDTKNNMASLGDTVENFSVTTTDGRTLTLDELLKEKDCVVVNVFTTWCGPCKAEFPEMEKAYEKDHARYELVAVADDGNITIDDVAAYQKEVGLTFPMGLFTKLNEDLATFAYPTTFIIDRNRKVGFRQEGTFPSAEEFEKIVALFTGDDYTARQVVRYTLYAMEKDGTPIPGVEAEVVSDGKTEIYTTGEDGFAACTMENPGEVTVRVKSVPEGYSFKDTETKLENKSAIVKLDVTKN